jgi:hypothetical protein
VLNALTTEARSQSSTINDTRTGSITGRASTGSNGAKPHRLFEVQDVVAEKVQLAERVVKVSNAPRGPRFVDLEPLRKSNGCQLCGTEGSDGHVNGERTDRSAVLG